MAYQDLVRRVKFLIAAYGRHGASHVAEVFRQERTRRRYAAAAPHPLPDRSEFMRGFSFFRDEETFVDDFHRAAVGRLPFSRANRKEFFVNLLLTLQSYDDILTDAEEISEGKFSALGVCIDEPDGAFDWSRDYSSGVRWPDVPYNRITIINDDGSDVKYVWELSRMYWIAWLGKAFWISGNGVWSREFMRLLDDWGAQNPPDIGVNWSMPMEIAIRGFWLVMGYGFFHGAPNIPDRWWVDYLRLAWAHGRHLMNNLEYFSNLTNHYLSNCFGLTALGSFFADTDEGRQWLVEGRRRLLEEIDHQVLPDGVHYERSVSYHRFVLEMYLAAIVLTERAGLPFPDHALRRIERMAEFTRDCIPPAGTVPQLGDSDDTVLMRLRGSQELYDHHDTLALAAAIFRRGDFRATAGEFSQAALLMLGGEGFERFRALPVDPPTGSRIYRNGGFAVLRNERFHLFADVGPIGLHGNNDTLSFTLSDTVGAIFIDPGTYCYSRNRAMRNELRATAAHNAPCLDGREIAEFDGLWRVREDRTDVRIVEWSTGDPTVLEAEHRAYGSLPGGGIIVGRRWELRRDEVRIVDRLTGSGTHDVSVRFTLPPECVVRRESERTVRIDRPEGGSLTFECSSPITVESGWYSPSYGTARPATHIQLQQRISGPTEISYLCRPAIPEG